jgi:hypothetical protein
MQVWGTFAVNDHLPRGAFIREVLLFDRLVIPVPSSEEERARWFAPNPENPGQSWDPARQEQFLEILGTESAPGWNGAKLAVKAPWDQGSWQAAQSKPEVARMIHTESVWQATRIIVAQDEPLPRAVEAIAAYPNAIACRNDIRPSDDPTGIDAADALVMLARPLLVPDNDQGDEFESLREAIELAAELREERAAYHRWLRDQIGASRLGQTPLDPESVQMVSDDFVQLIERERAVIARTARRRQWTRIEWATTVIGAGLGFAALLAAAPVLAPVAFGAPVIQFGGWVAGKRADAQEDPGAILTGASLFVSAEQSRGWARAPR